MSTGGFFILRHKARGRSGRELLCWTSDSPDITFDTAPPERHRDHKVNPRHRCSSPSSPSPTSSSSPTPTFQLALTLVPFSSTSSSTDLPTTLDCHPCRRVRIGNKVWHQVPVLLPIIPQQSFAHLSSTTSPSTQPYLLISTPPSPPQTLHPQSPTSSLIHRQRIAEDRSFRKTKGKVLYSPITASAPSF